MMMIFFTSGVRAVLTCICSICGVIPQNMIPGCLSSSSRIMKGRCEAIGLLASLATLPACMEAQLCADRQA